MLATDFYALLCIDLVLCAVFLRLTVRVFPRTVAVKAGAWPLWLAAILFLGLWLPYGDAGLLLLGYARGVLSDFSVTSVVLSVLFIGQRSGFLNGPGDVEKRALFIALSFAALLLYPTALGWGDWDAYNLGWGSTAGVAVLSLLMLFCFWRRFRLLPLLMAAALLAWSIGLLESTNLWDYLIDPWIACVSIGVALKAGSGRFGRLV
ncbi:MAG: hypothetical protein HQ446_07745 [Polaromonas sp.]|nr:hypothetical protein [Polaromonas sp.]